MITGWYQDAGLTKVFDGTIPAQNSTIYAKWEPRATYYWVKYSLQNAGTGRWYYLDASGAMVTGERKIDGTTYHFTEGPADMAGVMLQ